MNFIIITLFLALLCFSYKYGKFKNSIRCLLWIFLFSIIYFPSYDIYSKYKYGKTVTLVRSYALNLSEKIKNAEKVFNLEIKDSWGRPIRFTNYNKSYEIVSFGADKKRGGSGKDYDISAKVIKSNGKVILSFNEAMMP